MEEVRVPVLRKLVPVVMATLALEGLAAAEGKAPSPLPGQKPATRVLPADEKAIRAAVLAYLETLRLMRGVAVEVEAVSGLYARARTVPPPDTTGPAWVFAKKTKGRWQVLKGPGTSFEHDELQKLGVPRDLWLAPAP
jgi:hypothetical protein